MKYLLYSFLVILTCISCKTNQVEQTGPIEGLVSDKQPKMSRAEEENARPKDINQLIKALALTDVDEQVFRDTYTFYGKKMSEVMREKTDEETLQVKLSTIRRERDIEILDRLDFDQKVIYKEYLSDLRKKKMINSSNDKNSKI